MNSPTISRRHALGIFAGAAVLPAKALANYAPPRGEIRTDLAKLFADAGTAGTFVGYKVDDYLVISSDSDRSGEAAGFDLQDCQFGDCARDRRGRRPRQGRLQVGWRQAR